MRPDEGPLENEDLEELLRQAPEPEARPGFRAALEARFLAGTGAEESSSMEESGSRGSQGSRTDSVMDRDLERILVRLPLAEEARPAFRADLERMFVGAAEETAVEDAEFEEDVELPIQVARTGRTAPPVAADRSSSRSSRGSSRRSGGASEAAGEGQGPSRLRTVVVLTLAEAAAILVTLMPRSPEWRVVDVNGDGNLTIGLDQVAWSDLSQLGSDLTFGADLGSGTNRVELELENWVRLHVLPETKVTVGMLPEMGSGDTVRFTLHEGELMLETLDAYPGNPIEIETPESIVRVKGTALGVLRIPAGTCTCVANGAVEVEEKSTGRKVYVGEETLHFMYGDPDEEDVRHAFYPEGTDPHTDPLREFAARH